MEQNLSLREDLWSKVFKTLSQFCKKVKLKEFKFEFVHRIVVTKKEFCNFGIKTVMNVYTVETKTPLNTLLLNVWMLNKTFFH